tara:strand:- start:114 stop:299 length:186 start_codon:yes stop_codon:yes gene_type:complete
MPQLELTTAQLAHLFWKVNASASESDSPEEVELAILLAQAMKDEGVEAGAVTGWLREDLRG